MHMWLGRAASRGYTTLYPKVNFIESCWLLFNIENKQKKAMPRQFTWNFSDHIVKVIFYSKSKRRCKCHSKSIWCAE